MKLNKEDVKHVKDFKESWKEAPYPPVFVTCDAVVYHSDHVLLIERGGVFGKGKYALPGGFIEEKEDLYDATVRELYEETNLEIASESLRIFIEEQQVFANPDRDPRGRFITFASLFNITPASSTLPEIQAGSDAAEVLWLSCEDLTKHKDDFFLDHFHIVTSLISHM